MVNSWGLMAAQRGHEPPSEVFYELKTKRFFMDNDDFQFIKTHGASQALAMGGRPSSRDMSAAAAAAAAAEENG